MPGQVSESKPHSKDGDGKGKNDYATREDGTSIILEKPDASSQPYSGIFDEAGERQQTRAVISVINVFVFVFGFIILISLIAVANVFNTISTNIHLRGREFAMLKTMGFCSYCCGECIYRSFCYKLLCNENYKKRQSH